MLCDECKINESTYTVSVMMGEDMRIRHLCPGCMEKLNMQFHAGNLKSILSSLLSAISDGTREENEEEVEEDPARAELVCPSCGTTFDSVVRRGSLGCPVCYEAFREQLQPMLMQIHGRVTHAGRAPLKTREAQQHRNRQEELTRQMLQAVAQEDFETAAVLRDRLKALAEEEASAERDREGDAE